MINIYCNLCGHDNWKVRYPSTLHQNGLINVDAFRCTSPGYGQHAQIVDCLNCGYVYANPRWSEDDLMGAYGAVEDSTYVAARQGRELTFKRHLDALETQIGAANGRSLLDVGAYIGVFVEIASASGWNALGVEPSEWAAAEAQAQGINVIYGTQDAPELQEQQFDVITMWDVIEHVDDPSTEMAKAYRLLKPGGWLIVHTMDIDSRAARLLGARWPWLMDMHIHYFSDSTMRQMLEKNGFNVAWSGAQGRYSTMGYLATRVQAFNNSLGRVAISLVRGLGLEETAVSINMGDLFTAYAEKR